MKAKFPKDGQLTINALLIRKNFVNALRQKAKKKNLPQCTYNIILVAFNSDMFIDFLNVKSLQILEITDHRFITLIPVSRLTCLSYVDPLMGLKSQI